MNYCPVVRVGASVERVWDVLMQPEGYAMWWNAQTQDVVPPGRAQPGQTIRARTRELGRWWPVKVEVRAVDERAKALDLVTDLPFGIRVLNHIVCRPAQDGGSIIEFG